MTSKEKRRLEIMDMERNVLAHIDGGVISPETVLEKLGHFPELEKFRTGIQNALDAAASLSDMVAGYLDGEIKTNRTTLASKVEEAVRQQLSEKENGRRN